MWYSAKGIAAAAVVCVSLHAGAAWAGTGAAEKCMALPTDGERLECMRAALETAERKLEAAGTQSAAAPQAPAAKQGSRDQGKGSADEGLASLGAEQVAVREGRPTESSEQRRYQAKIVKFYERQPGQMRFELDNGQVWQQTAADAQRLRLSRGEPIAVELWSTLTGGYRRLLIDKRQSVRVERVR